MCVCSFSYFLIRCQSVRKRKKQELGAELAEQSDSSSDPVLSRDVGVERHGDDVVGGVSGGGQGASPLACLVDGRCVTHSLRNVLTLHRLQPHLEERKRVRGAAAGSKHVI